MMFDDASGAATAESYGLSLDDPGARKRIEAVQRAARSLRRYLATRPTQRERIDDLDDADIVTLASMAAGSRALSSTRGF
jgi:hypothetical protein